MKLFYIADWHYDHKNILDYDNRPFKSLDEMNDALIENWNSVVSPDDIVHILGDMFWCKESDAIPILDALNGNKVLIRGNHDKCANMQFIKKFVDITNYLEVKDNGRDVILCHYPIPCFKNHFYGWYHLYGHVHNGFEYNMTEHAKYVMEELYEKPCKMYNVGVMMPYMNYTPRTLDEIISTYRTSADVERSV